MQLNRWTWSLLLICLSGAVHPLGAAERKQDEDDLLAIKIGFYHQYDGKDNLGGNSHIDESEKVIESIILLDKTITDSDRFQAQFLADIISSASIARYHNPQFRALQSGASGNKNFVGMLGWKHAFPWLTLGVHGNLGKEYAYLSFGYGADATTEFFDKNTAISVRFQGYNDTVKTILYNGFQGSNSSRDTYTGEVAWTQVVTPLLVSNLTYNHTEQSGFLATSYNSVFVNGVETFEIAPDRRHRDSVTERLKYSLAENSAVEVGYRYYHDNWDIDGHTAELRFFQYVANRKVLLEPIYRFYTQDAAEFYQDSFAVFLPYRTSDPDLGDFHSNLLGFNVTFLKPFSWDWWKGDLDFGFNYNLRSDDLDNYWITAGYSLPF